MKSAMYTKTSAMGASLHRTLPSSLPRMCQPQPLADDLARALRARAQVVAQIFCGRTAAGLIRWSLIALVKTLVALVTLAFIYFAVEVPPALVLVMFLAPPAAALLVVSARGWRQRCAREAARTERNRRLHAEQGRALAEARLAILLSQIDPDFLFNTLASLQFLMHKDPPRANFMLSQLVQYLRLSAPSLRSDISTLGAQMDLVDAYLQLAAIRMDKRLFVQVFCPPELKSVPFPPMVIHGLAENALLHGAEPCTTPVVIQVRAYTMLGRLIVDVLDDGKGLSKASSQGPKVFAGRGLPNIRTRLEKHFEGRVRLIVVDNPARGVLSRIEIEDLELTDPHTSCPGDRGDSLCKSISLKA